MFLISRMTSISRNNSVDELITSIKKESRNWNEGIFESQTNLNLVIGYDSDVKQYVCKLFRGKECEVVINDKDKTFFREKIHKYFQKNKLLSNLDSFYDKEEQTRFDNFSDEELESFRTGKREEVNISILSERIEKDLKEIEENIYIGSDDGVPDYSKGIKPDSIKKWLDYLRTEFKGISNVKVKTVEDITSGSDSIFREVSYNYIKGTYFENERKYILEFGITLRTNMGGQSYRKKEIILSF